MLSPSLASQFAASMFASGVVDTHPLRVQCSLVVSMFLQAIGFHEIVERWCGDGGHVPVSKVLEAYIHCRFNSDKPVPVSRFQEWVAKSYVPYLVGVPADKLNEDRLGDVLEAVGPRAEAMWLEIIANAHRKFKLDLSYIINDTSSFYFEGEYTHSEFVRYGYSRDNRSDCKQINVNLNIAAQDSIPLLYSHLAGNTSDSATTVPNSGQLRKLFEILGEGSRKLIVIADRGLFTRQAIHHYKKAGTGFIGCLRDTCDERDAIEAVSTDELRASPLAYCAERTKHRSDAKKSEELYFGVRRTITLSKFTDQTTKVAYPSIEVDGLVVLAEGKRRLDSQKREDQLSKVESRLEDISGCLNNGKYKKYHYADAQVRKALGKYAAVKEMFEHQLMVSQDNVLSLAWKRKDDVIKRAAAQDGKYIIFTSESNLTNDELLSHFKSRDKVEKRVECLKGPVTVRPIYLHKDERILGLLFSTMAALLIFGLTEMQARRNGKKLTGNEVQILFHDFAASVLTFDDGSQAVAIPRGNKWQRQLHELLGVQVAPLQQVSAEQCLHLTSPPPCPWTEVAQETGANDDS